MLSKAPFELWPLVQQTCYYQGSEQRSKSDWMCWPLSSWPVTVFISSVSPRVPVVFWHKMSHQLAVAYIRKWTAILFPGTEKDRDFLYLRLLINGTYGIRIRMALVSSSCIYEYKSSGSLQPQMSFTLERLWEHCRKLLSPLKGSQPLFSSSDSSLNQ